MTILAVAGGFAGIQLHEDLYMPWVYGIDLGIYNDATVDYMTINGVCYGVSESSTVEPRQGAFLINEFLLKLESMGVSYMIYKQQEIGLGTKWWKSTWIK